MTSTSSVKAVEGTCHEINGKIAFNVEEDALVSHAGGDDDDYVQSFCVIEPDGFKLILHEILLCTKDPYISGDAGTVFSTVNTTGYTPTLENCEATLFSDVSGKDIEIFPGIETEILDSSKGLLLPINNYKYGVVVVSNHIGIKHTAEFTPRDALGDNNNATVQGYGTTAVTNGNTCFTIEGKATTYSATNGATHTNSKGVDVTHRGQSTALNGFASLGLSCDSNDGTHGYNISIIDSLTTRYASGVKVEEGCESETWQNAVSKDCRNTYGGHEDYADMEEDDDTQFDGGLTAYVLVDNDLIIAANRAGATKIVYIVQFGTPLEISELTTDFKVAFSTSATATLDLGFHDKTISGAAADKAVAGKMAANPFGVLFQTKTKRSRDVWK